MGSDIEVESKPGEGSTFHFDLAVLAVPIESLTEHEAPEMQAVRPARMLEPLITPPAPELADLHNLALQGNMRDTVSWARRVTDLDERRYRSFANHVRRLAESYESQAILALVQKHLRDDARA